MKKAAERLFMSFAFYRVCETIRVLYPTVDKLVANGKKLFVKSQLE
jgi:hypothetical protein